MAIAVAVNGVDFVELLDEGSDYTYYPSPTFHTSEPSALCLPPPLTEAQRAAAEAAAKAEAEVGSCTSFY